MGTILLAAEIGYCCFLISFIITMVLQLKAVGRLYFKEPWNIVELSIIITSIVAIAMFAMKEIFLAVVLGDLHANPGKLEVVYSGFKG